MFFVALSHLYVYLLGALILMADDENDDKNEKPEQRKNSRVATYQAEMAAERKNWHSFHLSFPPRLRGIYQIRLREKTHEETV